MELGICAGLDQITDAKRAGYDYVELGLSRLAIMDDTGFASAASAIRAEGLPTPVMNLFVPGTLRLVGRDADKDVIRAYLQTALRRAQAMGVEVIVFGSGGARQIAETDDRAQALLQIDRFLLQCNEIALPLGIRIAIEPLCKPECNVLNTVAEAAALSRRLALPSIGALADTYHMAVENEPLNALPATGDLLWHVHIANPRGRRFPSVGDGQDYAGLFARLSAMGYTGRVSVEAGTENFAADARKAHALLRALL